MEAFPLGWEGALAVSEVPPRLEGVAAKAPKGFTSGSSIERKKTYSFLPVEAMHTVPVGAKIEFPVSKKKN